MDKFTIGINSNNGVYFSNFVVFAENIGEALVKAKDLINISGIENISSVNVNIINDIQERKEKEKYNLKRKEVEDISEFEERR